MMRQVRVVVERGGQGYRGGGLRQTAVRRPPAPVRLRTLQGRAQQLSEVRGWGSAPVRTRGMRHDTHAHEGHGIVREWRQRGTCSGMCTKCMLQSRNMRAAAGAASCCAMMCLTLRASRCSSNTQGAAGVEA